MSSSKLLGLETKYQVCFKVSIAMKVCFLATLSGFAHQVGMKRTYPTWVNVYPTILECASSCQ